MGKLFKYSLPVGPSIYSEYTDEEFYDEKDVEYKASDDEVEDALLDIVIDDCFTPRNNVERNLIMKGLIKLMNECDGFTDSLEETYEDELHEYFENKAWESVE